MRICALVDERSLMPECGLGSKKAILDVERRAMV